MGQEANPYQPKPWEKIQGLYTVWLVDGKQLSVEVVAHVVNPQGIPLYLVDTNDFVYNWMNILYIKKLGA